MDQKLKKLTGYLAEALQSEMVDVERGARDNVRSRALYFAVASASRSHRTRALGRAWRAWAVAPRAAASCGVEAASTGVGRRVASTGVNIPHTAKKTSQRVPDADRVLAESLVQRQPRHGVAHAAVHQRGLVQHEARARVRDALRHVRLVAEERDAEEPGGVVT